MIRQISNKVSWTPLHEPLNLLQIFFLYCVLFNLSLLSSILIYIHMVSTLDCYTSNVGLIPTESYLHVLGHSPFAKRQKTVRCYFCLQKTLIRCSEIMIFKYKSHSSVRMGWDNCPIHVMKLLHITYEYKLLLQT